MKAYLIEDKEYKIYDIKGDRPYVEFYKSTSMSPMPVSNFDLEISLNLNTQRYFLYTSQRSGEQYLLTEDFVEMMQSMRPYRKGDEHSFVNKMRRKIMERDAYENINKIPNKGEKA